MALAPVDKKSVLIELREIEAEFASQMADFEAMAPSDPRYVSTKATLEDIGERLAAERRRLAETKVQYSRTVQALKGHKPGYAEMASEMPKWRVTVLVGLNSAAMVAILSAENLTPIGMQISIAIFLVGLVAALLSGSALAAMGQRGLVAADELESIDFDEVQGSENFKHAIGLVDGVATARRLAEVYRYLSLLAFMAAVVVAALNITQVTADQTGGSKGKAAIGQ